MIRINLLDGLPRGAAVQAKLRRGGASAFLSGREAILGGLFLLLGAVILTVVFALSPSSPEEAGAGASSTVGERSPEAPPPQSAPASASASAPDRVAESEPLVVADVIVPPSMKSQTKSNGPESAASPGVDEPAADGPGPTKAPDTPEANADSPRTPEPTTTPGPGWDEAARVTALEVRPLGRQLEVFLRVEGADVDISTFNLDNPGRIVVDVKNARLEMRAGSRSVSHPLLQKVRIAQNLFDPPRVRLVMDVGELPDMVIVDRSGGFVFLVTPDE